MQELTEMELFSLLKNPGCTDEPDIKDLHKAYLEFIAILTGSAYNNSDIILYYNQLNYAKIELCCLKDGKDKMVKKILYQKNI